MDNALRPTPPPADMTNGLMAKWQAATAAGQTRLPFRDWLASEIAGMNQPQRPTGIEMPPRALPQGPQANALAY